MCSIGTDGGLTARMKRWPETFGVPCNPRSGPRFCHPEWWTPAGFDRAADRAGPLGSGWLVTVRRTRYPRPAHQPAAIYLCTQLRISCVERLKVNGHALSTKFSCGKFSCGPEWQQLNMGDPCRF